MTTKSRHPNLIALALGPLACIFTILFVDLTPGDPLPTKMAAVTLWIAIWWLTEVVDMAITSLLPLVLMPLLGILDMKTVAIQYMDHVIFLFIGGFIIAFGLEKWNLHKRLSLFVMCRAGKSPASLLLGVMLTAWFLSMWMSNTATTLMLLPAVLATCNLLPEQNSRAISSALLIGLAYAASIGGTATLVGTPTNMIFYSYYTTNYPDGQPINFASWFGYGLPFSILMLLSAFLVLWFYQLRASRGVRFDRSFFKDSYRSLGRMSKAEARVGMVFLITSLLWFTRSPIDFGYVTMPGWSGLFKSPEMIQDSTVAVMMGMLLFFIPSGQTENPRAPLLNWNDMNKLPFGILLLFGAGFALAKGFDASGLSVWLAGKLVVVKSLSPFMLLLMIGIVICVISEFASNVASIQLSLPILAAMQPDTNLTPLAIMMPATFAASLGFMMPVATAPNTIVFSSGKIQVKEMLRAGFWVNLAGILLVALIFAIFK